VRWQYSGNAHGVIRGIGLVNCIYVNPETEQFWVIDFRLFDPDKDGKGKANHVKDMFNNIIFHKKLPFKTVLMDTWYATSMLMLLINDHKKIFYCPMRKNRLAKLKGSDDAYQSLRNFEWSKVELSQGKLIRLKGMPEHLEMKLFSVAISPNRTDLIATNDTSQTCADDTKKICAIRWYVGVSRIRTLHLVGESPTEVKDSSLVAREASWRESKTMEPSDNIFRKEYAQCTRL
jgi:hypothetical protein